jgi:hypothetical protein
MMGKSINLIDIIHHFPYGVLTPKHSLWCVNTETCRRNFNINLHHLFVQMLVHNEHSFIVFPFSFCFTLRTFEPATNGDV